MNKTRATHALQPHSMQRLPACAKLLWPQAHFGDHWERTKPCWRLQRWRFRVSRIEGV